MDVLTRDIYIHDFFLIVDYIPDITITRVDIRAVNTSTSTVIFSVSVSIR